jgi:lipid A ethanolaminephosphotransferase
MRFATTSLSGWFFTPQTRLIWLVTLGLMLTGNQALFTHLLRSYPLTIANAGFLISVALFFTFVTAFWLLLICHGKFTRWILAAILIGSAFTAYYMDEFGIVIDTVMLDNAVKTDTREVSGLLSAALIGRILFFGFLPAVLLLWISARRALPRDPTTLRLKQLGALFILIALLIIPFAQDYRTFVREHKVVRMYANPLFHHYSLVKWGIAKATVDLTGTLKKTAADSVRMANNAPHQLMIMVVGETARYDRFSLNGYARMTNPELAREHVVSFQQVTSCGTSTAVSVPCMFSVLTRKQYHEEQAMHMQNALDVLSEQGVKVLWRDNNSDSKGVALRVPYEDFKSPSLNPVCEANECRDVGMLSGLDQFVEKNKGHDILIVLHQMGNHGPEYYRRYPRSFKRFTPECMSGRLSECSQQAADNAYDNAILYTDHFLAEVIRFLKKYDHNHTTAMFYVSDHGESLGEHGIYLHAAPYKIAPKEQTHVPAILWLGRQLDYMRKQVESYRDYPLSHDDLFCTLLTAYDIQTSVCPAQATWLRLLEDKTPQ